MRAKGCALLGAVVLMAACSSSGGGEKSDDGRGVVSQESADAAAEPQLVDGCDPLDPSACLLPFPSDAFTRADGATGSGRRVAFPQAAMPENSEGTPIDPTEWNRNDGFSPASILTTLIPGLDATASALPRVTDIGSSLAADASVVLVDTDTGERVALWAELDANAPDPGRRALLINPAIGLTQAHHYVVGLRGIRDAAGDAIEPSRAFAAFRDGEAESDPDLAPRVETMEATFGALEDAGVDRADLYLAWDFTVASTESLTGRLLSMRDETFAELDDGAPPFTVETVADAGAARVVRGTFTAPRYLAGDGGPGSPLNNDDDPNGIPTRNGEQIADYVCTVPKSATPTNRSRMAVFGHGLLGSADEGIELGAIAATINVGFCATDWIGMSAKDVEVVVQELGDLSGFRALPDRLLQAHLHFLLLGRLLRADDGFASDAAFSDAAGDTVIDTSETFFLGASQGGILGGATTAVSTEWSRAMLAVPGMGYSLLVRRSIDFDQFAAALSAPYPDTLDQAIVLDLAQMLWDRGENSGYASHLARDPLPGTEEHDVLLLEAFGDHQVPNVGTEKLARTIGVARRDPMLAPGRSTDVEPFWGIEPVPSLPYDGSAIVVWDFGTPAPPVENLANRGGEDPHGMASEEPAVLVMASEYLAHDGVLVDVCNGGPCRSG